jgi:hypothetical protein
LTLDVVIVNREAINLRITKILHRPILPSGDGQGNEPSRLSLTTIRALSSLRPAPGEGKRQMGRALTSPSRICSLKSHAVNCSFQHGREVGNIILVNVPLVPQCGAPDFFPTGVEAKPQPRRWINNRLMVSAHECDHVSLDEPTQGVRPGLVFKSEARAGRVAGGPEVLPPTRRASDA